MPLLFSECVKYFNETKEVEVKRGKDRIRTTLEIELRHQIEACISNANTRIKRLQKKIQANSLEID